MIENCCFGIRQDGFRPFVVTMIFKHQLDTVRQKEEIKMRQKLNEGRGFKIVLINPSDKRSNFPKYVHAHVTSTLLLEMMSKNDLKAKLTDLSHVIFAFHART